jgi:hypothetical protein
MQYSEDTKFLTIQQVADILRLSPESVAKLFTNAHGVVDLSFGGTSNRRYRVLRIPVTALERFLQERKIA